MYICDLCKSPIIYSYTFKNQSCSFDLCRYCYDVDKLKIIYPYPHNLSLTGREWIIDLSPPSPILDEIKDEKLIKYIETLTISKISGVFDSIVYSEYDKSIFNLYPLSSGISSEVNAYFEFLVDMNSPDHVVYSLVEDDHGRTVINKVFDSFNKFAEEYEKIYKDDLTLSHLTDFNYHVRKLNNLTCYYGLG